MSTVSFAYLIAPLLPDDFFANYWEKKTFFNPRNQPGYYDRILSVSDIDAFLWQQNLMPESMKLMQNGTEISQSGWTRTDTLINGNRKTVVNPDKVFSLFQKGATIIINAAEKSIPKLARACRAFEQEMKINIQSNIYITPPNSQGFAIHYDPHDIFSMQIKGPKTWKIYHPDKQLPTKYRPFTDNPELAGQFDIHSGDMLYMPRGTIHEAFSSTTSTIHVNFSCKPRYGFHLLEELARIAEEDEVFFRYVVPSANTAHEDQKAYTEKFKQKLFELVDKVGIEKLLETQYGHFAANQLLDFDGRLLEGIQLDEVGPESVVSRRKGFTALIVRKDNGTQIKFGTHTLVLPRFVDHEFFLQTAPFKIKDIKGLLTNEGRVVIAKEFIGAGFLRIDKL